MSDEQKIIEVPEKFKAIVETIEKMSVLDLSELVKVFENKFGVSASAPAMMMAAPVATADAGKAEERSTFNVELTSAGGNKISVIKIVRELTGLGLKDAKDLVDGAPKMIKEGLDKATADEMKKKVEETGATVTLK